MKILVLNGPNINMVGIREPGIYGKQTFADLLQLLDDTAKELGVELEQFQSNHEGALVDKIQESYGKVDGIVINPACLHPHQRCHSGCAESRVHSGCGGPHLRCGRREPFRQVSYAGMYCEKTVKGQGLQGYAVAMRYLWEKYHH